MVVLLLILGGCQMNSYIFPKATVTNIGDPYILTAPDGAYYMYATSSTVGYKVWKSTDLENWEALGLAYQLSSNTWSYKDFWAPEVVEANGKYYMYYTAREKGSDRLQIGVAIAENPAGPFIDALDKPLFDIGSAVIDASVFTASNGEKYLYYSKDCSENIVDGTHISQIYGVKLGADMLSVEGDHQLLLSPIQKWETQKIEEGWLWNEGPSVIEVDGVFYMTYSGNPYWSFDYSIGVATSDNPLGPFTKDAQNPVVKGDKSQEISGPGHNSIFTSHDKQKTYIAYHVHMYLEAGGGERKMLISEVSFSDRKMKLI